MGKFPGDERHKVLIKMRDSYQSVGRDCSRIDAELQRYEQKGGELIL